MRKADFRPEGRITAIGSMPHTDPQEACRIVLRYLPEIPAWPQLPRRSPLEQMHLQFSEGFPGAIIRDGNLIILRNLFEEQVPEFLEEEREIGVSPQHAAGLFSFLSSSFPSFPLALKGQMTGPLTFCLAAKDEKGRSIICDEEMAEAAVRLLRGKARWQERKLSEAISKEIIIFLDEPSLSSLGSPFAPAVPDERIRAMLEGVLSALSPYTLKGIHCCGNADWELLLSLPLDILSFDAYNFSDSLLFHKRKLCEFVRRGGILAWGIVPTDEERLEREGEEELERRLWDEMRSLASEGLGVEEIFARSLLTPSCGLGYLSCEGALRALELLSGLSRRMRRKFAF